MDPSKSAPYPSEPPPPYSATPGGPVLMTQASGYPVLDQPNAQGTSFHGYSYTQQPIMVQPPVMGAPGQQVTAAVIVNVQGFGPYPAQTTCPNCSQSVMTSTMSSPGLLTWILSGTLLLIGCWAGCCLIPCCVPECQDVEHRCPNCKTHLGTFRRI